MVIFNNTWNSFHIFLFNKQLAWDFVGAFSEFNLTWLGPGKWIFTYRQLRLRVCLKSSDVYAWCAETMPRWALAKTFCRRMHLCMWLINLSFFSTLKIKVKNTSPKEYNWFCTDTSMIAVIIQKFNRDLSTHSLQKAGHVNSSFPHPS